MANGDFMEEVERGRECQCLGGDAPYTSYKVRRVGMDLDFGEVSVLRCKGCGRFWLRYLLEYEHLTTAGRWFLGLINSEVASSLKATKAKKVLESLDWYYRGGSAFGGEVIRTSPGQLKYWLTPFPGSNE